MQSGERRGSRREGGRGGQSAGWELGPPWGLAPPGVSPVPVWFRGFPDRRRPWSGTGRRQAGRSALSAPTCAPGGAAQARKCRARAVEKGAGAGGRGSGKRKGGEGARGARKRNRNPGYLNRFILSKPVCQPSRRGKGRCVRRVPGPSLVGGGPRSQ